MLSSRLLASCCLALACAAPVAHAAGAGQAFGNSTALGDERNVAMRLSSVGIVTALDPEARLMAVNGPRGTITYRLDPKVDNADAIQVGDRVQVDYVAAFVLSRKRRGDEKRVLAEQVARNSDVNATLVDNYNRPILLILDVVSVDKDNLVVRLRGPGGDVGDYPVHDRSALAGVRAGGQILAAMNQAVAVGVTPMAR
jgi:hypothetical protein